MYLSIYIYREREIFYSRHIALAVEHPVLAI